MTTTRKAARLREEVEDDDINDSSSDDADEGNEGENKSEEVLSPSRKRRKRNMERNMQRTAVQELLAVRAANGGKKRRGDIKMICESYNKDGYQCVTRRSIEHILSSMKKNGKSLYPVLGGETPPNVVGNSFNIEQEEISTLTEEIGTSTGPETVIVAAADEATNSENNGDSSSCKKYPGRKKGSTKAAHKFHLRNLNAAITEAATEYEIVKKTYAKFESTGEIRLRTGKTPNGILDMIIERTEKKYNLDRKSINRHTVKTRVTKGNVSGLAAQKISPVADLEPGIVEWCIELARMGAALTKDQVIGLANELIQGTKYEQDLAAFKIKRGIGTKDDETMLGAAWYRGLMKRHDNFLQRGKCRFKDNKRHTWCTYEHFSNMYDSAYESMVKCGVAEKVSTAIMYDKEGKEVDNPNLMHGLPSMYRMLKPENCLFVDETGSNTNMKEDGHIGGRQYVLPQENYDGESGTTGLTTDLHFTVLCFTSGTGIPVMCAIILKSEKPIEKLPYCWRFGVDERIDMIPGENELELLKNNYGQGNAMQGGPQCVYKGKTIPCFVASSPASSITGILLMEMLKTIDSFNLFDRTNGNIPFLLLDGHQSRLQLPFLRYINSSETKWMVNIGVPYGTHLWQPADSAQLNGSFKCNLAKAKLQYIRENADGVKTHFRPSDIIPLVNMTWAKSFGCISSGKKSIEERGWLHLNYILLQHPKIKRRPIIADNTTDASNTTTSAGTGTNPSIVVSTVNTGGKLLGNFVNMLMEDRLKDEGRRKKFELQKQQQGANAERREKLRNWTKHLTSGQMAGMNQYALTDEDLVFGAENKYGRDEMKKIALAEKSKGTQERSEAKFRVSFQKYVQQTTLSVTDIRTLLVRVSDKKKYNDSPIKTRKEDIFRQWNSRKYRLDSFVVPLMQQPPENKSEQNDHDVLIVEPVSLVQVKIENNVAAVAAEENVQQKDCVRMPVDVIESPLFHL